ncbi:MAG TPA: hypothetical protein ENK18_01160 [Deltaproteobacteria bacterium]|nr:hypothetical protein [Deltaproteobacteria bacterium]
MEKGARVEIVSGPTGRDVVGTVFWIGDDRFNEGTKRLGVQGDDGETYWVSGDNVEASEAAIPEPQGPQPQRGDRVAWRQREEEGEGEVFWTGENKHGPGLRLGIKCDDGETRWFDARAVTLLSNDGPTPGAANGRDPRPPAKSWSGEEPPF